MKIDFDGGTPAAPAEPGRRDFLKVMGVGAGLAGLGGLVVAPKEAWVEAKSEPPIARLVISLPTFTEPSN